jgi:hypothetical protein
MNFSTQLQTRRIDVALLSETHLEPHERFSITNYHIYWNDRHPGAKGTATAVRKGIPRSYGDLPPLISIEATGVSIQFCLQLFTSPRPGTGVTQTSTSS